LVELFESYDDAQACEREIYFSYRPMWMFQYIFMTHLAKHLCEKYSLIKQLYL